jgi:hypothetical protein
MIALVLVLISLLSNVKAGCDNSCSGHGTCGQHGVCECYDNWGIGLSHDSGDCSERICPYEFAWVDTPDKKGDFHKYAECSNRGICNRDSGECDCFPGYEGKGCQRTSCPNDCSGHGRCKYIENLPFYSVPNDYSPEIDFLQDAVTFDYYYWDSKKTRGCVCDPEYGDVDCSKRLCQYGTDVMDQRPDLTVTAKYQTQQVQFQSDTTSLSSLASSTFAITFKSRLNETFTTAPIQFFSDSTKFHQFVLDVQGALLRLPNKVIDKVEVQGRQISSYEANLNITFVGDNVQGPQNLLTIVNDECLDGCSPKVTGLYLAPSSNNVTTTQLSDFNSYECGRRGKCDYTSGLCTCFAGYTGLSCNVITSLV